MAQTIEISNTRANLNGLTFKLWGQKSALTPSNSDLDCLLACYLKKTLRSSHSQVFFKWEM